MSADEEGFLYPEIQEDVCIHCDRCQAVCPILSPPTLNPLREVYAAYALDKTERMSSTSGGVFAVLARSVLEAGGVVCGATYESDFSVRHVLIDDPSELIRLKGTKYVQSETGQQFSAIRMHLEKKQLVLFSGTPCQVAGLKSFLGHDDEHLICIDLICHGVPSPLVWQRYLQEASKDGRIAQVDFRHKHEGTDMAFVRFCLENGDCWEEKQSENLYMKGFLRNYYVRPSCFSCHFKGMDRCSDLTIGDFWSIKEFHPQFADECGNSAIIVHSEKGKTILETAEKRLALRSATMQEILLWNECLVESVAKTYKRVEFFQRWKAESICDLVQDLSWEAASKEKQNSSIKTKLKHRLKRFMKEFSL